MSSIRVYDVETNLGATFSLVETAELKLYLMLQALEDQELYLNVISVEDE